MEKRNEDARTLSRREVLKALAAASGALGAAAFLPGKWAKPVIEAGVLPAHAQGTDGTLQIVGGVVQVTSTGSGGDLDPNGNGATYPYQAKFDYLDTLSLMSDAAKLYAHANPCMDEYASGDTLANLGAWMCGNTPYNGTIQFNFNASGACINATFFAQLKEGSRLSNEGSGPIPDPN